MRIRKPGRIVAAVGTFVLVEVLCFVPVRHDQETKSADTAENEAVDLSAKEVPSAVSGKGGRATSGATPRNPRKLGRRDKLIEEITANTATLTLTESLEWAEKFENSNDYILAVTTIVVRRGRESPGEILTWYNAKVSAGKPEKEIAEVAGSLFGSTNCLTSGQMKRFCSDRNFGTRYFSGLSINHDVELESSLAALDGNADLDFFAKSASGGLVEAGKLDMATKVAVGIKSAKQRAEALATVAYECALETPEKAVESWQALATEDPGSLSRVASSITAAWFTHDSLAASEWVRSLPGDSTKDNAISTLARMLRRADPEGAVVWAQSIVDPEIRDRTIQLIELEAN